jgi:hypothetical protein
VEQAQCHNEPMDLAKTPRPSLDDASLSQDAPYVRALVAQRLEALWRQVQGHIQTREDAELEPDVRVLGEGVRILKSLVGLYRLDSPAGTPEELVGGTNLSTRALVDAQLAELEKRSRQDD